MPVNVLTRAEKGEALTYEQMDNNLLILQDAVNSKADEGHGHIIDDIEGLQDALDGLTLEMGAEITGAIPNGILYVNAAGELSSDGGYVISNDSFMLARTLDDYQAMIAVNDGESYPGISAIIFYWQTPTNDNSSIVLGNTNIIDGQDSSVYLFSVGEFYDNQSRIGCNKEFVIMRNFNETNEGAAAIYNGLITLFSQATDAGQLSMNLRYPEGFSIISDDASNILDIDIYGNGYWHAKDVVSGKQASVYMDNNAGATLSYSFGTTTAYINTYDNRTMCAVNDSVANTVLAQIITSNEYSIQETVNGRVYFAIDTLADVYNWGNVDELGNGTRIRIQDNLSLIEFFGSVEINGHLNVNDDRITIATPFTPASSTATGTKGEVAWDDDYIYVCIDTDTWKRVALSAW